MVLWKNGRRDLSFVIVFILLMTVVQSIPIDATGGQGTSSVSPMRMYEVTFNETGLPLNTSWTVRVITNHSANLSYTSNTTTIRFNESNGSYNYVVLATYSYVTADASGLLNVSGQPVFKDIRFERTAVSEYYQPFTMINSSQKRYYELNPAEGPSALSFGVMNTTVLFQVYGSSGLIYEGNVTGQPTNFNTTSVTSGYGYVNFQSNGSVYLYATDIGSKMGYLAFDLWNYYISNYSASLITLPPHLQQVFGTGTLNSRVPTFIVENNTGMSFTLKAPYYRESVPMAIFVGEGVYNPVNGNYWWAQLGFNNWGMYDVSYAGWGVFSNYANTTGGTDDSYPLVPNETYNFTMETVANHSWEFLVNGYPVRENGHSAFYTAPTDFADGNAYLGVEVLVGQRAGPLNSTNFFQGSIIIPNAESFRIDGKWVRASNISFLYGVRDWEDGHGGSCAGMNLWGIEGNIQNSSIPNGEIVLNNGGQYPFEVPDGENYDVYPISGNFTLPLQNKSVPRDFIEVSPRFNGTVLVTPLQDNTEVSVVKFSGNSSTVEGEYNMLISKETYIENPSIDSRAAVFAVAINASTSQPGYGGSFQEIVMNPVFSSSRNASSLFSLGNVSSSYQGMVYVPVYASNVTSLEDVKQVFSYDPSLLEFSGVLGDVSSEAVAFSTSYLAKGVIEVLANGSFLIISNLTLLYYLVFLPVVKEQLSTSVLLDLSAVNGFTLPGNGISSIILAEGWNSIGPSEIRLSGSSMRYGGMISSIGYSPYNLSVIYAAAGQSYPFSGPNGYPGDTGFGGMLKTTDGGRSWSIIDLGIQSASVTSIAVQPNDTNVVVIETRGMQGGNPVGGGIFKTVNGGASWEETYDLGGYQLQYENGTLFATTFHSILESKNFGTTWTEIANFASIVTSSLILNGGSKIYVGLWTQNGNVTDELMESLNGGKSFVTLVNFTQSEFHGREPSIGQIIASPSNEDYMWAIVDSPFPAEWVGNPSLFRSVDGGDTWQLVNTSAVGLGPQQEPPTFITYEENNGSVMYLDGLGGLYRSDDGGNLFFRVPQPQNSSFIGMVSVDPINGSIVFLCSESGLFESRDGGGSWSSISNFSTNLLFDVAVDNQNVFATNEGLSPLYSNDSGKQWTTITKGYLGIVDVDPYNSSIVIMWTETHTTAGGPFFFVSHDGGNSFFLPRINFTAEVNPSVNSIAFSENEIFVPGGTGIFFSTDGGATWNVLNGSPRNASAVADSPSDQSILYASNGTGLYRSSNYGQSWTLVSRDYLDSIAVDPQNSSIIAVSGLYGSWYAYKPMLSHDGGKTFTPLSLTSENYELSSSYVYFEVLSGKVALIFTSDQGLYVSENMGVTWLNCSYNLPSTVLNSFFVSPNGTAYIATYGAGIFESRDLFNFSFYLDSPVLTGYLPYGGNLSIDGNQIKGPGYFSLGISEGENTIYWEGEKLLLNATNGLVYFFNFSNMQKYVKLEETGLPSGAEWHIIGSGESFSVIGNGTIELPPGITGIYILPEGTDYSIYYPNSTYFPLNTSLETLVRIQFHQVALESYRNLSSSMNGMFWSTQASYNMGYILYAGGTIGLLNISTNTGRILQIPNYSGIADVAVPFNEGFLIGGSASPDRPGVYYYNVTSNEFTNYSVYFPAAWNSSNSRITAIFTINSTSFGFIGGGIDMTYFGIIEGTKLVNLTGYLPSTFMPKDGSFTSYSAAYLPHYDAIVVSRLTDIGIFYLQNTSFHDISSMMPSNFYIGWNQWTPSSDFISSNGSEAAITGENNGEQFTVMFQPGLGIRNISGMFPSNELMDTVSWSGDNIVLSGSSYGIPSSPIFIYNTSTHLSAEIETSHFGNTSLIDSALLIGNSLYFTTFHVITVPNKSYVIYSSYYGKIGLTPTGYINVNVNIPAKITIGNETYYATDATLPEFTGNYTLTVSSPGFVNYSTSIYVKPFETTHLNITLAHKIYEIAFIENGLPAGSLWGLTLNGTTKSSTSSSILFELVNGTYAFSVLSISGYSASPSSGNITVNGRNLTQIIVFSQIIQKGYLVGSVSPSNASIWINGTVYGERNGQFNISLYPGTYQVRISAPGYATYVMNVTIAPSSVTKIPIQSLTKLPARSQFSPLPIAVTVLIIAAAIATFFLIMTRRKGKR
ncbi:MAG: PEGA domain-containing protein [Thermoplasmata archaeon]